MMRLTPDQVTSLDVIRERLERAGWEVQVMELGRERNGRVTVIVPGRQHPYSAMIERNGRVIEREDA